MPSEDNPIAYVEELKKSPILSLVMPEDRQVSEKKIALASMVSKRQRNQGYGDFSDVTPRREPWIIFFLEDISPTILVTL